MAASIADVFIVFINAATLVGIMGFRLVNLNLIGASYGEFSMNVLNLVNPQLGRLRIAQSVAHLGFNNHGLSIAKGPPPLPSLLNLGVTKKHFAI